MIHQLELSFYVLKRIPVFIHVRDVLLMVIIKEIEFVFRILFENPSKGITIHMSVW